MSVSLDDGFLTLLSHHLRAHFQRRGGRLILLYGTGIVAAAGITLIFSLALGSDFTLRQVLLIHAVALSFMALFASPPRLGAYARDQAATESFFLTTGWAPGVKFHAWLFTSWMSVLHLWLILGVALLGYAVTSPADLVTYALAPADFPQLAGITTEGLGQGLAGKLILSHPVLTSTLYLAAGWLGALVMASLFLLAGNCIRILLGGSPVLAWGILSIYLAMIFFLLTIHLAMGDMGYFSRMMEGGDLDQIALLPDLLVGLLPFQLVLLPLASGRLIRFFKAVVLFYPLVVLVLMVGAGLTMASFQISLPTANYFFMLPFLILVVMLITSPFELLLSLAYPSGSYQLLLLRTDYSSSPFGIQGPAGLVNLPVYPEVVSLLGTLLMAAAFYHILRRAYTNMNYGGSPWD